MALRCSAVHEDGLDPDGTSGFPLLELTDPTPDELDELGRRLELSAEALQAARADHLRPQLLARPGCLVVVVKTPTLDEASEVELGEVVVLVTPDAAALIGRASGTVLDDVRHALRHGARVPAQVLLAVVAVVVPDLDEVLFGLDEDVSEVEEKVFSADRDDHSRTIYELKRELLELRRAVVPLAAVIDRLSREPSCPVPDDLREDFRNLAEHTGRTADGVEHLDGLIGSVLDAQLAQIGVRQNEDQRKISAWAAIALVPTVVGGIYGMNFEHMPELSWRYGYPAALTLVVSLCLGLYLGFRRSGWL